MEKDDLIPMASGGDSRSDSIAHLDPDELRSIRSAVLDGIADLERGEFTEYAGRDGFKLLAEEIIERGRERLALLKPEDD